MIIVDIVFCFQTESVKQIIMVQSTEVKLIKPDLVVPVNLGVCQSFRMRAGIIIIAVIRIWIPIHGAIRMTLISHMNFVIFLFVVDAKVVIERRGNVVRLDRIICGHGCLGVTFANNLTAANTADVFFALQVAIRHRYDIDLVP